MKRFYMRYSSLIIVFILLVSCSPTRRLERLINHHPWLKTPDTLVVRDTILIPLVQADTIIHIDSLFDTVRITKAHLEVSLLRLLDNLYLQGQCKADTLFLEKRIPVEKIITVKPDRLDQLIEQIPWIMAALIAVILFFLFLVIRFR